MASGVQYQPLTQHIVVGRLNKHQTEFIDREDRTTETVWAAAHYISDSQNGSMDVTNPCTGKTFRIHAYAI